MKTISINQLEPEYEKKKKSSIRKIVWLNCVDVHYSWQLIFVRTKVSDEFLFTVVCWQRVRVIDFSTNIKCERTGAQKNVYQVYEHCWMLNINAFFKRCPNIRAAHCPYGICFLNDCIDLLIGYFVWRSQSDSHIKNKPTKNRNNTNIHIPHKQSDW